MPNTAGADEACNVVDVLRDNAGSKFENLSDTDAVDLLGRLQENPETCSRSLSLGGQVALTCRWGFEFRAVAAKALIVSLNKRFETCLGDATIGAADQLVNHPDSYDLKRFDSLGMHVSVSVKDKGALGKTYVFVTVK